MSARPLFWPASKVAARKRISRHGFLVVTGAHLAAVAVVFLLANGPARISVASGQLSAASEGVESPAPRPAEENVVWMDPATFELGQKDDPPLVAPPETVVTPDPTPAPILLPRRAPVLRPFLPPAPRPVTSHPRPPASATAVVPKKKTLAPVPRPSAKTPAPAPPRPRPAPATDQTGLGGNPPGANPGSGAATDPDGPAGAGGTDWYAAMLHERFYAHWEQPTSVFATTRRYVATLRLRIERDGRISDCRLVRPSGLVPMDESVLAAAAHVGRVDPPPVGLLRGGAYVVNVGFVRE